MSENDPYAGRPYWDLYRDLRRPSYDELGYGDQSRGGPTASGGRWDDPGGDPLAEDPPGSGSRGAGSAPDPLTDPWPYQRSAGGPGGGDPGSGPWASPGRGAPPQGEYPQGGSTTPRARPPRDDNDPLTDPRSRPFPPGGADQGGYPAGGDSTYVPRRIRPDGPGDAAGHQADRPVPVPGQDRGDSPVEGNADPTGWDDERERPRGRRRRADPAAETGAYPGESSGPTSGPDPEPRSRGRRRRAGPDDASGAVPPAREPASADRPPVGARRRRAHDRSRDDEDDRPWAEDGTDHANDGSGPDGDPDDLPDHQARMREAFERKGASRAPRNASKARARRGRGGHKGRGRRRRSKLAMAGAAAVLALAVAVGGLVLRSYMFPPDFDGGGSGEVEIVIEDGETGTEVGDTLVEAGVVASTRAFTNALGAEELAPGTYRLRSEMSAESAVGLLLDPETRAETKVTVREGLRSTQILDLLAEETSIEREELQAAYENHEALELPEYAEEGPEGYLYPDTYTIMPDAEAEDLLVKMVDRFKQTADEVGLEERAAEAGMTPNEVMANAAIIQAESGSVEDMSKVARVVYNRLDAGIELGMDSTCFYVIDEYGIALTGDQLQQCQESDSDYATYGREGLPAGPFVSPGKNALNAALDPADGDWLYFVATDPEEGVTEFAETHEEFERLKDKFEENRSDQ